MLPPSVRAKIEWIRNQQELRYIFESAFPEPGLHPQVWLERNADILATHGVLYPMAGRGEGDYRFGHHCLASTLKQRPASDLAIA